MDKLNMKIKDGAIKLAFIFRIFAGIPSIPVTFEAFSFCRRMKHRRMKQAYVHPVTYAITAL